jgi:hypothetical protein
VKVRKRAQPREVRAMAAITRWMRDMTKDEQRRFAAFAMDKFWQLQVLPAWVMTHDALVPEDHLEAEKGRR